MRYFSIENTFLSDQFKNKLADDAASAYKPYQPEHGFYDFNYVKLHGILGIDMPDTVKRIHDCLNPNYLQENFSWLFMYVRPYTISPPHCDHYGVGEKARHCVLTIPLRPAMPYFTPTLCYDNYYDLTTNIMETNLDIKIVDTILDNAYVLDTRQPHGVVNNTPYLRAALQINLNWDITIQEAYDLYTEGKLLTKTINIE